MHIGLGPSSGSSLPRRLCIFVRITQIGHSSVSIFTISLSTSDSGSFQFPPPPRSQSRNMKKLSLTLSTWSSCSSLAFPPHESLLDHATQEAQSRCPSAISTSSMLHRKKEDGSPTAPYSDGPIKSYQIYGLVWRIMLVTGVVLLQER